MKYKKWTTYTFCSTLLLFSFMGASCGSGSGTSDISSGTIEVSSGKQLNDIRKNLAATYHLVADIDLAGNEWVPIGTATNPFTGIFDGQGHVISHLTISQEYDYLGLFGFSTGTIKNTILDEVDISVIGEYSQIINAGAFVGCSTRMLENLHTLDGEIYIQGKYDSFGSVGGIAGEMYYDSVNALLVNISNGLTITGNILDIGGIVGQIHADPEYTATTIADSHNTGDVTGNERVGGLVGGIFYKFKNTFAITNSYNTGDVTGTARVGGLVGFEDSTTTITNSYNTGDVTGTTDVGGLVGFNRLETTIITSFNTGEVTGTADVDGPPMVVVGGLMGFAYSNITITDSYNRGTIYGENYVGGLVGFGYATISITNSYNSGPIVVTNSLVGGLVGVSQTEQFIVRGSINFGEVVGRGLKGAIIGSIPSTDIEQNHVYFTNSVINGCGSAGNDDVDIGVRETDLSIFDIDFFMDTLGWDDDIWDFTTLDAENEKYPVLKTSNSD